MLNARVRFQRLLAESRDVLAHPQPRVFYQYAARSSAEDALTYTAVAAFLIALGSMLLFGGGSAIGLVMGVINELFKFYLFAGAIHFIGTQRGGRGSFDEVAYTFALFYVPIRVIVAVLTWLLVLLPLGGQLSLLPLAISLAGILVQAYYAHVAVKGVMGLREGREAWVAVGVGLLILLVVNAIFSQGLLRI
jgi:hypothetical protein